MLKVPKIITLSIECKTEEDITATVKAITNTVWVLAEHFVDTQFKVTAIDKDLLPDED